MSAIEQSPRSPSASGAPAFLREGQRRTATPAQETTYYQRPMIKRPTWKWYIPLYFVLGGVAGGTALIGAAAELLGGPRHRSTVRHARYVGLAIAPLCAGLLIADLGRPSRFHHMLRIFKGSSPLNVGTWILSLFGVTSGVLAARQATEDGFLLRRESALGRLARRIPSGPVTIAHGLLGCALGGYTGVLLAATAVPLWAAAGVLLGPMFLAAALTSGAAVLVVLGLASGSQSRQARQQIQNVANVGTIAQLALAASREVVVPHRINTPLRRGRWGVLFQIGTLGVGLIVPTSLRLLARTRDARQERRLSAAAAICTLIGTVIERFAIVEAGKDSADDPLAYQELTKGAPGEARSTPQQQAWWTQLRPNRPTQPYRPHVVVPEE